MINIVHVNVNFDDERKITSLDIKLKYVGDDINPHVFTATASMAFFKTTLLADVGRSFKIIPNPNRPRIINLVISIENGNLSCHDVANFLEAFQKALDETKLF